MHTPAIRIFIVAPALVSWGLERLLQTRPSAFELAGAEPTLAQALPRLAGTAPQLVVLDMDGGYVPEALEELRAATPANVLVLTSSSDTQVLDAAVLAGVRGVVRKSDAPETLLKALEKVQQGELWIDRGATNRIFMEMARRKAAEQSDPERQKIATLTTRERQTIIALASDVAAPGKVIASRLCISEHTLRNHLSSIYSKLGLSNRLDLYAYATRHKLAKVD